MNLLISNPLHTKSNNKMSSNKKTADTKKSTRVKKDKVIELVEPVTDVLLTEKEKEPVKVLESESEAFDIKTSQYIEEPWNVTRII